MDRYAEVVPDLTAADGEVVTAELASNNDTLVKAFALGPGAAIAPHEHPGSTNVFHVLVGTVTVVRDGEERRVTAPGVVVNDRGAVHGARNEGETQAVLTATFAPAP